MELKSVVSQFNQHNNNVKAITSQVANLSESNVKLIPAKSTVAKETDSDCSSSICSDNRVRHFDEDEDDGEEDDENKKVNSKSKKKPKKMGSSKMSRKSQKQNALKDKIVQEVLDEILPNLGKFNEDGMAKGRAMPSQSKLVRWMQFLGCSPLSIHDAVLGGQESSLRWSIKRIVRGRYADPELINQYDQQGHTALSIAVKINDYDLVRLLLDNGASPNIPDEATGRTPVFFSVQNRNREITESLIYFGAYVNVLDTELMSPLMLAAVSNDHKHCKVLCKALADVDVQDERGWTALHYAVMNDSLEAAKVIVKEGADKELRDCNGKKAMTFAKYRNNGFMVSLLASKAGISMA